MRTISGPVKTEQRHEGERQPDLESLEAAVAQAIEACDGDLRATGVLAVNEFIEAQISHGYRRGMRHGRFNT
jgi:hypothetical protein